MSEFEWSREDKFPGHVYMKSNDEYVSVASCWFANGLDDVDTRDYCECLIGM